MNEESLLIHQPTRLRIVAVLSTLEEDAKIDFPFLAKELELTEGNLGAHLRKLEDAGLVLEEKTFVARKPKTWLSLTGKGRRAFLRYLGELEELVGNAATVLPKG